VIAEVEKHHRAAAYAEMGHRKKPLRNSRLRGENSDSAAHDARASSPLR
jgi:hypothetical protein